MFDYRKVHMQGCNECAGFIKPTTRYVMSGLKTGDKGKVKGNGCNPGVHRLCVGYTLQRISGA
jgi:hypothetical protein